MKMTVLVSYHLSNEIKKKESISGFFRLICLEPIFFRLLCFESFLFFSLSVLRPFFYKSSRLLQTHKSSVGGKTTKKKRKLNQKHGQFPFCRHPIKADNTTWASIGSAKCHMGPKPLQQDDLASSMPTRL